MFQVQLSADFYKELLQQMSDGVYFVDMDRKILYWNEGATRLTGYKSEEVIGLHCQDNILCHIDGTGKQLCNEGCPVSVCMGDGKEKKADIFLRHKQGRRVPVNVRVQPIRDADGTIVGAVEIFSDNTALHEERRKADAMERLAFLDPVTQLPNRRFLEMSVRTAMVEYQTHGDPFGILIFDLIKFKSINDRFGHVSGDRALQEVAKTLTGALRGADIVGRWGGDEFLAIIHSATEQLMIHLAKRCVLLVDNSSFLDNAGELAPLSISVGGALARRGEEISELIERADAQMYREKGRT
jgi:diguanylate cyclase (GGDEF)-like protein/PAS domain S-box-containing protein